MTLYLYEILLNSCSAHEEDPAAVNPLSTCLRIGAPLKSGLKFTNGMWLGFIRATVSLKSFSSGMLGMQSQFAAYQVKNGI